MPWIVKSDAEINNRFRNETSLSVAKYYMPDISLINVLNDLFDAENIRVNAVSALQLSRCRHRHQHLFIAEHVGIPLYMRMWRWQIWKSIRNSPYQALNISLPSVRDIQPGRYRDHESDSANLLKQFPIRCKKQQN